MGRRDALEKFQTADELYREGQFTDALAILDELDERFPGQKNVLLPKARCLYRLNQLDEAQKLSEIVEKQFGDPKATRLLERIRVARAGGDEMPPLPSDDSGDIAVSNLGPYGTPAPAIDPLKVDIADGFTSKKIYAPVELEIAPERNWVKIGGIAAGIAIVLAIVCLPAILPKRDAGVSKSSAEQMGAPVSDAMPTWGIKADDRFVFGYLVYRGYTFTPWGWAIFLLAFVWVQFCISLTAVLAALGRMPHESVSDNALNIAMSSFICAVPFGIVCVIRGRYYLLPVAVLVGVVRAAIILRNRSDFGFGEILIYLLIAGITIAVFWGPFLHIYFSTLFAAGA